MGFFYRIFLSRIIGAEGLGLYQMIFPVLALALSVTSAGLSTAISHQVSRKNALGDKRGIWNIFFAGAAFSLLLSFLRPDSSEAMPGSGGSFLKGCPL
ncbi:MAG: oligosaccharide flippase family protein [Lachnospiraceae bacterium]